MTRLLAFWFVAGVCLTNPVRAAELPKDGEEDSFEVEPAVLIQNRDRDKAAETGSSNAAAAAPDIGKLEKDLERARKSAAGAERLYRIGVLARVDVEKRALRVIRLEADLENTRLSQVKQNAISNERQFVAGKVTKVELTEIEASVERAEQIAKKASADREQAEIAAAEVNLQRQRKLLALGSGH